tara:strand:- start:2514 stop:3005 length:492 start_codon:yes stop_codon:yes gene_type:complete
MAHKLNISSSLEPIIGTSDSEGGKTYTANEIDKNVGTLGGLFSNLEYASDKAIKYVGIVDQTDASALTDGEVAFEGTATTTGQEPTTAKVLAVRFDSELGTVGRVWVIIGSQTHARLKVGEACVIPISGDDDAGLAIANLKLKADAYNNGVNEATVTVIMAGV